MKKILYIIPYILVCICLLYIIYLKNSYNESLKVKDKADISYVDNTFRKKSVPIIENDFDNN